MPEQSISRFDQELLQAADRYRVTITRKGAILPEDLTLEEWNRFGDFLAQANNSVGFWVGDWINFGEQKWGEKYASAMDLTGFEYQTLAQYASVAHKVNFYTRVQTLTFRHHRQVASLPPSEQSRWLKLAEDHGLSSRLLALSIQAGKVLKEAPQSLPAVKTHIPYVNRIVAWWRDKAKESLQDASPEHRQAIRRDLLPIVEIYNELGGELEGGESNE